MPTFGDRLRTYMEHMCDMEQQHIAKLLNKSIKTVSGYASTGKSGGQTPSYSDLMLMADTLGLSLDWLTGRSAHPMWAPSIMEARLWLRGQLHRVTAGNVLARMASVLNIMSQRVPLLKESWFCARMIGVSEDALSAFWDGTLPTISVAMVNRVAEFTGLPDKWIMSGKPEHLDISADLGEWIGPVQRMIDQGITAADAAEYVDMFIDTVRLNKAMR